MSAAISNQPTFSEITMPAAKDGMIDKSVRPSIVNGGKNVTPPVFVVGESHLLLGEKLVVHQRVADVERPQHHVLSRAVHDIHVRSMYSEIW